MFRRIFLYLVIALCISSCGPAFFVPTRMKSYSYGIEPATKGEQTQMKEFLKPYSTHINGTMNEVVGNVTVSLNKTMPECTLGCFMTDAYLESAQKKFGKQVDMAFMNTGGIRLNSIEPGPITIGKIYELMPFDNLMVLVDLTGSQLQAFLDHISSRGGWPVSGGSYTIENKKATKVEVGGKPIDPEKKYTVAVSDYVANGGDQSNVLKNLPQENIGYLQRDAIIEYVQKHKTIGMPEGTRVTKVND